MNNFVKFQLIFILSIFSLNYSMDSNERANLLKGSIDDFITNLHYDDQPDDWDASLTRIMDFYKNQTALLRLNEDQKNTVIKHLTESFEKKFAHLFKNMKDEKRQEIKSEVEEIEMEN